MTDPDYYLMSLDEVGLYHILLNWAWTNDGLPCDPIDIIRITKINRQTFLKAWAKVALRFPVDPTTDPPKRRSPRQQRERLDAISKSVKAAESVKVRYERTTTKSEVVALRASESVSVSDSASEFSLIPGRKENLGRAREAKPEVGWHFEEFWAQYPRQQHREQALHAWCFVATVENEEEIFACLASYKASNDVLVRGAVMYAEKWLNDQNVDHWASRWEPPKKIQRKMTASETALQEILREKKNGTD